MAAQQSGSKPHELCSMGDCARPRLQEPDQGHGRTAAAHQGGVGQSLSVTAYDTGTGEDCILLN